MTLINVTSPSQVVVGEIFGGPVSMVGQFDMFLGYAGMHAFRELWRGISVPAMLLKSSRMLSLCIRNITKGELGMLTGELSPTWWAAKRFRRDQVDPRKHESNCKNM